MSQGIEYEAKLLRIEPTEVVARLRKLGASYEENFLFRRYVFDTIPAADNRWLRLRTNGQESTLTAKEIGGSGIDGTQEWETVVSDFEATLAILQKAGLESKGYQENHRFNFRYRSAILSLDFWPQLQPYLEIEASDATTVEAIAQQLGYTSNDLSTKNTAELYREQTMDLTAIPELRLTAAQQAHIASIQQALADQAQ